MAYVTDKFDDEVVRLLKQGSVGLLPTDTIYGLSCRALDHQAVKRVHRLKNRRAHKPFIVLISDIKMLNLLSISAKQANPVKEYWPGALSVIFEAKETPDWLQLGSKTLAVRQPDYPQLLELIDKVGPIISTSANLENESPADSLEQAQKIFGDELDFYVDAGNLAGLPSSLASLSESKLKLLRQGAVRIKE